MNMVLVVDNLMEESVVFMNGDSFPPRHPLWGVEADLGSELITTGGGWLSYDSDVISILEIFVFPVVSAIINVEVDHVLVWLV